MLNFSHGARMCACPRSYKRPPGTTGARRLLGVGVFVGTSPSAAGISRWYARAQCAMAIEAPQATALFVRPELGMRSWLTLKSELRSTESSK